MAYASVGTLGSNQSKSSSTTVVITTSATAEAGNLVVVTTAWDNTDTVDGDSTRLSVTDSAGGNTWTRVREYTGTQAGAAADGVTNAIFISRLTNQINSGGTITVTSDTARVAKAAAAWEFTTGGAPTVEQTNAVEGQTVDPAALSLTSLPSRDYLFIHAFAHEQPNGVTFTPDGAYTALTKNGSTGGAASDNVYTAGGFRIATDSGTETVDAATSTDSNQHVQLLAAIYEASGTGHTASPSSTLALTDAVAKARGLGRTDTLALADAFARTTATARSVTDSVVLADATTRAKVIPLAINDTLSLSDARTLGRGITQADTLALADARAHARGFVQADTLSLTDARAHARGLVQADSLALADLADPDLDTGGTDYELPVDDTVTLTDAQAKARGLAVTDTLALTDSAARAKAIPKAVDDTLTLTDARALGRGLARADTLALTDSASTNLFVGGTDHTRQIDDAVALTDARAFSRGLTRTEALSLTDNFTRLAAYQRTPADTLTLADLLGRVHTASRTFTDSVTLADLISPEVPGEVDIDDIVLLTDELTHMLRREPIAAGHIEYALTGSVPENGTGRIAGGDVARITEAEGGMVAR